MQNVFVYLMWCAVQNGTTNQAQELVEKLNKADLPSSVGERPARLLALQHRLNPIIAQMSCLSS